MMPEPYFILPRNREMTKYQVLAAAAESAAFGRAVAVQSSARTPASASTAANSCPVVNLTSELLTADGDS
jgi:hypothetical protein